MPTLDHTIKCFLGSSQKFSICPNFLGQIGKIQLLIVATESGRLKFFGHWLWWLEVGDQIYRIGCHRVDDNPVILFSITLNCFLGSLTSFWPRLNLCWCDIGLHLCPNAFIMLWWARWQPYLALCNYMHVYKNIELLDSCTIETRGLVLVHSPTPLPFDLHIYGIIYSFYGARSNGMKRFSNFRIH